MNRIIAKKMNSKRVKLTANVTVTGYAILLMTVVCNMAKHANINVRGFDGAKI
jgi:selenophosphate synthase